MSKIIIIDASVLQRKVISGDIVALGYDVVLAENGEEAYQLILDESPDCLITDLLMPVVNGEELIERLRREDIKIPIIVVSANSTTGKIQKLEELGINAFLNKPYDLDELKREVERALG